MIFLIQPHPPYLSLTESDTAYDYNNYRMKVKGSPVLPKPSAPRYLGPGGWAVSRLTQHEQKTTSRF